MPAILINYTTPGNTDLTSMAATEGISVGEVISSVTSWA